MTDVKPYLIRSFYGWISDNKLTPYIDANCTLGDAVVPKEFHNQERVVLNISPQAIKNLNISNDNISFNARFNNVLDNIILPINAIIGIYAKENNQGMWFNDIKRPIPNDDNTFKLSD